MLDRFKRKFGELLDNKSNRHIILFESDDWGAIRMPSPIVYENILKQGYAVNLNKYESLDHLEREEDIIELYQVLTRYRDFCGNNPVFTLNYVMANPVFEKALMGIIEYEPFIDTYKKQYDRDYPVDFVKSNCFRPQFHGLCHFNIPLWMNALERDLYGMRWLCSQGCVGSHIKELNGNCFVKHYDAATEDEQLLMSQQVAKGLELFYSVFGFNSLTAIAPNYIWPAEFNKIYWDNGVRYLQGGRFQIEPVVKKNRRILHWLGEKSSIGLRFGVRNCQFEPAHNGTKALDRCMKGIDDAFFRRVPAIICTHRLNYMGYLSAENRKKNLELLDSLLSWILKKYPDVEFMSTDTFAESFFRS